MKQVKVKCIAVCPMMLATYTKGKIYTMTVGEGVVIRRDRRIQADGDGVMGNLHVIRVAGDDHRYCVAGFEGTVFDAAPHRFRKSNRSAAFGQVEIDWTRCKRSIRNQARNILKEIPSPFLERLARK